MSVSSSEILCLSVGVKESRSFSISILCLVEKMLKLQSCKLYNSKYMTASAQIANTEIFACIAVLVFKLLSCKVLFINRKDNRNC